jgi:hypothetical protein
MSNPSAESRLHKSIMTKSSRFFNAPLVGLVIALLIGILEYALINVVGLVWIRVSLAPIGLILGILLVGPRKENMCTWIIVLAAIGWIGNEFFKTQVSSHRMPTFPMLHLGYWFVFDYTHFLIGSVFSTLLGLIPIVHKERATMANNEFKVTK